MRCLFSLVLVGAAVLPLTNRADESFASVLAVQNKIDGFAAGKFALSEEARDELTREALRSEYIKRGVMDDWLVDDNQLREAIESVALASKKPTPGIIKNVFYTRRYITALNETNRVKKQNLKMYPVVIPWETDKLFDEDLRRRTKGLAESGTPPVQIVNMNSAFVDAIMNAVNASAPNGKVLTPIVYASIRKGSFETFVKVTITSDPSGATVKLDGEKIGSTEISNKSLDRGITHEVTFEKQDYKTANRRFVVSESDEVQSIHETLLPDDPQRTKEKP